MVSQEFKAAVSDKNLLRTRIMLKDSFVVDPAFSQLKEMLSYEELVQLVTNFSEKRINHLKKVASKVLEHEVAKIRQKKLEQSTRPPVSSQFTPPPVSRESSPSTKEANRQKALKILKNEGGKIQDIMAKVNSRHTWKPTNVDDMERAAREILRAAQDYKNNR